MIGPTNCHVARVEAPNSLRALYGTEGVRNALHGSDSRNYFKILINTLLAISSERELNFFFGDKSRLRVKLTKCFKLIK